MKKLITVAVASAFMAGAAYAADLGYVNQAASPALENHVAAMDWSGFYAGVNVGYGWAAAEVLGLTFDQGRGALGGAQIGYNHDFGGVILGVEADVQFSDVSYQEDIINGVTGRTAIDNFGTVRARAGLAVDRFMPYVTAGFAWANASVSGSSGASSITFRDSYKGWTVGGGVEYAVIDNVSLKAEYLYTDFGTADFGTGYDVKVTSHAIRAGVNFHF